MIEELKKQLDNKLKEIKETPVGWNVSLCGDGCTINFNYHTLEEALKDAVLYLEEKEKTRYYFKQLNARECTEFLLPVKKKNAIKLCKTCKLKNICKARIPREMLNDLAEIVHDDIQIECSIYEEEV